jgi:uncharacterized membrane protein YphA (DoxX/SURF4 family)
MNFNTITYAVGAILLGAVGFYFQDFAMQWQPVPAGVGMRVPLANLSAAILVIGGAAILSRKAERGGALALAAFYGFWAIILHGPIVFSKPADIGAWNGVAETSFLTAGGIALFATGQMRGTLTRIARIIAGASALIFGIAHFRYADFTATMVPSWIPPNQLFWAYATGAGHFAAGLALVSGVQARLAATLLAGMMGSFVVLLHIPRVFAAPEQHVEWIMLGVSTSLAGAALLIRKYST